MPYIKMKNGSVIYVHDDSIHSDLQWQGLSPPDDIRCNEALKTLAEKDLDNVKTNN